MNAKLFAVVLLAALPSVAAAGDAGGAPRTSADSRSTGGGEASSKVAQQNDANGNGSDANGGATPSGSNSDANDANTNKK